MTIFYAITTYDSEGNTTEREYYSDEKAAVIAFKENYQWLKERTNGRIIDDQIDNNKFRYVRNTGSFTEVILEEVDAEQPRLWAVYHYWDQDGGFGDAVQIEDMVGIVRASLIEREAFLKKWDKPEVYEKPYAALYHHEVGMSEVSIIEDISSLRPY